MARTDIHRPSAIQPEEYDLIALMTVKDVNQGSVEAADALAAERARFNAHREYTGANFSSHAQSDGAGQCQICGAHCVDYAIFYHEPTNADI